jgi:hypothetical protein
MGASRGKPVEMDIFPRTELQGLGADLRITVNGDGVEISRGDFLG